MLIYNSKLQFSNFKMYAIDGRFVDILKYLLYIAKLNKYIFSYNNIIKNNNLTDSLKISLQKSKFLSDEPSASPDLQNKRLFWVKNIDDINDAYIRLSLENAYF